MSLTSRVGLVSKQVLAVLVLYTLVGWSVLANDRQVAPAISLGPDFVPANVSQQINFRCHPHAEVAASGTLDYARVWSADGLEYLSRITQISINGNAVSMNALTQLETALGPGMISGINISCMQRGDQEVRVVVLRWLPDASGVRGYREQTFFVAASAEIVWDGQVIR